MAAVGDTVFVESWDFQSGFAQDEYILMDIRSDCVVLKHVALRRRGERIPVEERLVEKSIMLLEMFDLPIGERARRWKASIDEFVAEMLTIAVTDGPSAR